MITEATANDIDLIQEILHHCLPNNSQLDDEVIKSEVLEVPNEVILIDRDNETLSRVAVMHDRKEVKVVWLLPHHKPKYILFPVLLKALKLLQERYPDVIDFKVYGVFADGRGCLSDFGINAEDNAKQWQQFFPNSTSVKWNVLGLNWFIEGNKLSEVINDAVNAQIDGTEGII